jgi:hypothetical protein
VVLHTSNLLLHASKVRQEPLCISYKVFHYITMPKFNQSFREIQNQLAKLFVNLFTFWIT